MEEAIFENLCKHSKENLTESQNELFKGKIILYIFGIIYLALFVITLFFDRDIYLTFIFLLAAVLMFVVAIIPSKKGIKLTLKRRKEMYGTEEIETEIKFFDDRIFGVNKQSKGENTLQYDRIKKVLETKNLYIVCFPNKLALLVDKNGFTKGNKEDFIAFLKTKAPKAKFKVKA